MQNETNPAPATSGIDGKTIAIISYFSVVGWIIAFVLFTSNKSQMAAYHLRQSLALILCGIACYIIYFILLFIGFFLAFLPGILGIALFVLWIIGLIAAINGQEKPVPVIGNMAQEIFAGIK
jgi:uncharacterized membrane protein